MKRSILSIVFFVFLIFSLKAQDLPKLSQIIPPSPNAAALGKYGDYPVSEYSGVPSISVPIYEIKLKGLTIPINLSYHASGNKVDDVASWVGLGWSLNAGGVITRSMHGLPDEFSERGFISQALKFKTSLSQTDPVTYNFLENIANQIYDSEPDEFFYNFLDKSGKFVMTTGYKPVLIPYKSININYTGGFKIVDENGIQYFFDSKETTQAEPNDGGDLHSIIYPSSWYLTKIISPSTRDSVYFDYSVSSYNYKSPSSQSLTIAEIPSSTCYISPFSESFSFVHIQELKLKTIRFKTGRVEFEAFQPRTDVQGGQALTDVKIYNTESLIKKFSLSYNYLSGRLNLESLIEKNKFDEELPAYKFSYNTTSLPPLESPSQDHWGYYNNASNVNLIPEMLYLQTLLKGADRSVNPVTVKAGILEKIIYPTGGYTVFEYGSNTYGTDEDNKIVSDTVYSVENFVHKVECHGNITINAGEITLGRAQFIKYNYGLGYENDICLGGSTAEITLTDSKGIIYRFDQGFGNIMKLEKGTYQVKGRAECEGCPRLERILSFTYEKVAQSVKKYRLGPGLRIEKIIKYDGINPSGMTTVFDYNFSVEQGRSSGALLTFPKYDYYYSQLKSYAGHGGPLEPPLMTCDFYVRSSTNQAILGTTQGGLLGYQEVTKKEFNGMNQINGSIISTYSFVPGINFTRFPFIPPVNPDHLRGLLKNQKILDKNGILLKETLNEYVEVKIPNSEVRAVKVAYGLKNLARTGVNSGTQFDAPAYSYNSAWVYMSKSIEKDYFLNPQGLTSTLTTYEYNGRNLKPSMMKVENSKQENLMTNYYYPSDFVSVAPYDKMVDSNIVAPVVEQQLSKNGTLQTLVRTNFYSPFADVYLPKNQTYKTNGYMLDTLVQFHAYDIFGNVLVRSKNRGPKECYIWSYGGNYPIAKIENADYSTVVSVLGGAIAVEKFSNAVSPTKETVNAFLAPLRTATSLKQALISTFIFEPSVGMKSSTDSKNRTTYYEYDGFLRLKNVKDQNGFIIKNYTYNYQNTPLSIFKNSIQSQFFKKNNCSSGQVGSSVEYTVEAGTYSSSISVEDANNKALADINLNGQNYANQKGTCMPPPCIGNDKKVIGGVCETGMRINISSSESGTGYECVFRYKWSDGSQSEDYVEINFAPCKVD